MQILNQDMKKKLAEVRQGIHALKEKFCKPKKGQHREDTTASKEKDKPKVVTIP